MARVAMEDEKRAYEERARVLGISMREDRDAANTELATARAAAAEAEARSLEATRKAQSDADARVAEAEARLQQLLAEQRAGFERQLAEMEKERTELRARVKAAEEKPPKPPKPPKVEEPAKPERKKTSNVMGGFDFDEDSGVPYAQQIATALRKNAGALGRSHTTGPLDVYALLVNDARFAQRVCSNCAARQAASSTCSESGIRTATARCRARSSTRRCRSWASTWPKRRSTSSSTSGILVPAA
eukprot:5355470-Prymnesium_polylepis.2